MKKIRVGIIGTGDIANICHIPAYLKLKNRGVEVVALCDVKPAALERTRRQQGLDLPTWNDYRKMLAEAEIDVVSVCTPNFMHMPATVAALKAGKHVLCEKPIARNAREAGAMVAAAKKYRRKLMIGQQWRWHDKAQVLRRAIDSGALGDIYYVRGHSLRRRGIPGWGNFIDKEVQGGGPMVDIGVHILDLMLYLMDFPKPVTASGCTYTHFGRKKGVIGLMGQWDPKKFTVEDFAAGFVRFANGATLTLEASFAANIADSVFNAWFLGTRGGADLMDSRLFTEEAGTLWDRQAFGLVEKKGYTQHDREIELFIEAVRKDKPVPVPGEQALITQKIIDGIYASAETGKEVRIR